MQFRIKEELLGHPGVRTQLSLPWLGSLPGQRTKILPKGIKRENLVDKGTWGPCGGSLLTIFAPQ